MLRWRRFHSGHEKWRNQPCAGRLLSQERSKSWVLSTSLTPKCLQPRRHHYMTIEHGCGGINQSRNAHECGRKVILGRRYCMHIRENFIELPFAAVNAPTYCRHISSQLPPYQRSACKCPGRHLTLRVKSYKSLYRLLLLQKKLLGSRAKRYHAGLALQRLSDRAVQVLTNRIQRFDSIGAPKLEN